MTTPTSRDEFKEYCLRNLGKPVINIEVDEEQLDDRVDEALRMYQDYHHNGTEKIYLKHIITQDDITNRYITIPENVLGVIDIFPLGDALSTNNLFNIKYQFMLNYVQDITGSKIAPYYIAMQYIALLEEVFVGRQPIRYNRHSNRLYIDADWDKLPVGSYIVAVCYEVLDPTVYTDVWKDRWLLRYATALIKRQWGTNLKKYQGMALPGQVQFSGQQIYNEAIQELSELDEEMLDSYSLPPAMLIG